MNRKQYLIAMDDRAQISAELLIILAAMAALALFLIDQLNTTATEMNETYSTKISEIEKKIENMGSE
ncbi:MAG: hypothetical protein PWP76_660 [Candidatus Diapherotrites archaeon]|nr:hypothetical protein [Candidatus Diapherotrites archaeon]MDN5367013.1 hypothetical protein [Candidatus Diapherotrites archaeon]